ncbi:hypothetical protein ACQEV2_05820 [Streptomyces sp. CA-251387]|uniref:hypothetical protein n=1 Tax=Streptomyces sp. CA-251387 TaxID=3240064 RepID=UPI003D8F57F4
MRVIKTVPIVALAVGALTLSACSGQDTNSSPANKAGERVQGAPARMVAEMTLPLEAYQLTPADYERSQQALWKLTTSCMKDIGFTSFEFLPSTGTADQIEAHEDVRYGTYNQQDAERNGYRPDFGKGARGAVIGGEEPKFTAEEEAALDGVSPQRTAEEPKKVRTTKSGEAIPEGGCYGQALDKLTGGQSDLYLDDTLAEELNGQSYEQSLKDQKVTTVFARWSACMAAKGFTYKSPIDANNDPSFTGDTAGAAEKKVAVADTACKNSTDLVSVWHDAEAAIQRTLISEHGPELAKRKALNSAIRAKTSAVLTS